MTGTRRHSAEQQYARLEALLAERGGTLLGAAVLLTGGRESGEDLLQMAIERVLRRGVPLPDELEGFVRRTMYNLATDRWRGLARRREVFGTDADRVEPDHADAVELRWVVTAALATLPPRQRAVLVLRYFEQLSESETAAVLGCSLGTVKSSASRALQRLRGTTPLDHDLRLSI